MSDNYVSPDTIYGGSFQRRIHPVSDYHTINRQQCFFPNRKAVCSLQYTTALSNARHAQRLTTTTTTWHMCVADTRQQIRNTSIPELSATTVLNKSDQLKKKTTENDIRPVCLQGATKKYATRGYYFGDCFLSNCLES